MIKSDLQEQILDVMSRGDYYPCTPMEISVHLGLPPQKLKEVRHVLSSMEEAGVLLRLSKQRYVLRRPLEQQLTGTVHKRGEKTFFRPDSATAPHLASLCTEKNIVLYSVPPRYTLGAMEGDIVRITAQNSAPARSRRKYPERNPQTLNLRIVEILRRGHRQWVGIYQSTGKFGYMAGDGKSSPQLVRLLTPPPPQLLPGMCIVVKPEQYPIAAMEATGSIQEVLGWPEDSHTCISAIMHSYGLGDPFPDAVLQEAQAIPESIPEEELRHREDWRDQCVITIDPESARDYDDAIHVRKTEGGGWELAVHIADVSHYVRPGSALDAEAQRRGNSTYLPDRVLPMLPPRLCDGICSLKAGELRLTRLCGMSINRQGKVIKTRFAEAVISSMQRLTYPQVLRLLEQGKSTGNAMVDTMLEQAHKLAQLLRSKRIETGALNLDMPELRIITDAQGQPIHVEQEESDIAHQLIEEFMLSANESVAKALNAAGIPTIYRIHEAPKEERLQELALQIRSCGIQVGNLNTREELNRIIARLESLPDGEQLRLAVLKAMMRARYAARPMGHYGLAKGDYCHFTSPIRRYADLVVHRSFSRLLSHGQGCPLPSVSALDSIAEHISETERNSAAAEAEARQSMLTRYMELQCERTNPRIWEAAVLACWEQGLIVEIAVLRVKGYLSGAELPEPGTWYFERHAERWTNSCSGICLHPGCKLRVIPRKVDRASGFVDFSLAE